MYQQHPVRNEFFDFNQFCEENDSILRSLFKETKNLVDKSYGSEPIENIGCLVSLAIYHDLTSFEGVDIENLSHEEEDTETMAVFFSQITTVCQLYELEEQGIINMEDGKASLTNYGEGLAQRTKRKAEALSRDPDEQK